MAVPEEGQLLAERIGPVARIVPARGTVESTRSVAGSSTCREPSGNPGPRLGDCHAIVGELQRVHAKTSAQAGGPDWETTYAPYREAAPPLPA